MASNLRDDISYVKLILLLFKGGTFVAKKHIQRISNLEQKSIDDYLKNNGYDFNKATKKKQITTKQMQILFPGGSTPTDLDCWDISLLSYILINLFDAKLELFEKDAINTLRKIRNELAHIASMAISEEKFMGEWVRITQVLYRLTKRLTIADQDVIDGTIDTILTIKEFHVATDLLRPFEGPDEFVHEVIMEKWKTFEQKLTECCNRVGELEASNAELKSQLEIMARVLVSAQTTSVKDKAHAKLLETLENIVSRKDNRTEQQGQSVVDEVHTACTNLVADMRGQGVDITKVEEGSILVTFRCQTISALMNISTYFANRRYAKRLIAIEQALGHHVESLIKLEMNIILDTLYSVLTQIEQYTENKSIALTLTCKGEKGQKNVTDLFGNGSPSNSLKILAKALSNYVGEQVVLHSTIDVEYKQQLSLVDENMQTTRESCKLHNIAKANPDVATPPLVAAIDIGTVYSGYALSFRREFIQHPLQIMVNMWSSGGFDTLKTPSCILFRPDQSFHSFGYEAENHYAELWKNMKERDDWFFFTRFKMLLYNNKELNRDTMLKDERGRTMPAMKVFSESIRFLRDHLIQFCDRRGIVPHENEILWMLTVPAIWNDTAKQFIREAAIKAGIETSHLSLAMEPEVASMYCRYAHKKPVMEVRGHTISCFDPGSRYLVLDAGGVTVDITVHETQCDGTVRELYKGNGGPWGSTTIDDMFLALLTELTGDEVMEEYKRYNSDDFLKLMRRIKIVKERITQAWDVIVLLPLSLIQMLSSKGTDLRSLVYKKGLDDKVELCKDKLLIRAEQVKAFFTETCDNIVSHLKDIFNKTEVRGTDTILMVGGFSQSKVLQGAVKRAFPNKTTITSAEAGMSVLKGAVIFGHCPTAITSRVTRYTYGVQIVRPFDPRRHPLSKKIIIEGTEYCDHCFDKHVEEGQEVEVGLTYSDEIYIPTWRSQTSNVSIQLMASDKKNPYYTDEPGCNVVGNIVVDVSGIDRYERRVINLKIFYGTTELSVEANVRETGRVLKASFDFLG